MKNRHVPYPLRWGFQLAGRPVVTPQTVLSLWPEPLSQIDHGTPDQDRAHNEVHWTMKTPLDMQNMDTYPASQRYFTPPRHTHHSGPLVIMLKGSIYPEDCQSGEIIPTTDKASALDSLHMQHQTPRILPYKPLTSYCFPQKVCYTPARPSLLLKR